MMSSDSTSLIKTNDNTKTIPTLPDLAGGYTESTFEDNKWGYKINTGNYIPFVSGATIAENDTTTNDQSTTLTFATKVNYLQAEGTYQTVLNFTAVANYVPVYMQYVEDNMCTTTPMLVVDNRDNQEYTIQRLADGNCWMMNNLNLGATELTTDLTNKNTNLKDSVPAGTFNGWKKTVDTATYTEGEYIALEGFDEVADTALGVLYNYCAASAGAVCDDEDVDDLEATAYDICPAGWRLPHDLNLFVLAEYDTVEEVHASVSDGGFALPLAGYFENSELLQVGQTGTLWSGVVYSSTYANGGIVLDYGNNISLSSVWHYRNEGLSVRCVLKKDFRTLDDITYMQEVNPDIVMNTQAPASATLLDSRDGKAYEVVKIGSKLWMGQNLRFTGTYITPEDTNINIAKNLTYYQTDSDNECESIANGGNSENTVCIKELMDTEGNPTIWYNLHAATAGTITAESNVSRAEYDICPKGWTIPTTLPEYGKYELFNPVLDTGENISPGGWSYYYRTMWWMNQRPYIYWRVLLHDVYGDGEYQPGRMGHLYSDMDCQVPMSYGKVNLRCVAKE